MPNTLTLYDLRGGRRLGTEHALAGAMGRTKLAYAVLLAYLLGQSAGAQDLSLDPPEAPAQAVAGQPFALTYRVHWEGAPADYIVFPAEAESFDGGSLSVAALESFVEDGMCVVEQRVDILADAAGTLTLPEVRVPYRESGGDASESPAVYLVAPTMTIEVADAGTSRPWVLPVALVAVLAVLVASVWWWRRRGDSKNTLTAQSPGEQVQAMLHDAQRRRLDGDHYAFYQTLAEVMSKAAVDEETRALKDKLERRVREVGYQGARPHDDELTGDYRDVERAVARWKEESGR